MSQRINPFSSVLPSFLGHLLLSYPFLHKTCWRCSKPLETNLFLLKQVFDTLRTTMFILGMMSVFIGISLLAPDDSKGILIEVLVCTILMYSEGEDSNFENFQVLTGKIILL